jgi:endoglucanase
VYVIVDWHEHSAHEKPELAAAFFDRMAKRWGQYPNVIWETFNEPVGVTWGGGLKRYHERIVDTIRRSDPDNLITLGTPNWSQEVDAAAADPLTGRGRTNLVYTLHFYACSHRLDGYVGTRAQRAIAAGLPLFVSEWGATHADGGTAANPGVCTREADEWHSLLDRNGIWSAAWKLDGCADTSCLLRSGAPRSGGWSSWLQGHGSYVVTVLRR